MDARALLFGVVVVAMVAAGCSDDDDAATTTVAPATTASLYPHGAEIYDAVGHLNGAPYSDSVDLDLAETMQIE